MVVWLVALVMVALLIAYARDKDYLISLLGEMWGIINRSTRFVHTRGGCMVGCCPATYRRATRLLLFLGSPCSTAGRDAWRRRVETASEANIVLYEI
jgi:hypothetical protein